MTRKEQHKQRKREYKGEGDYFLAFGECFFLMRMKKGFYQQHVAVWAVQVEED
jgi:hypothetical protein